MTRKTLWFAVLVVVLVGGVAMAAVARARWYRNTAVGQRQALLEELQPVALANCELKRFGETYDGGYLLCANLLTEVRSAYSYGISGYDGWGCDIPRQLKVKVHEYDCFNLQQPVCDGGALMFHPECVAGARVDRCRRTHLRHARGSDFPKRRRRTPSRRQDGCRGCRVGHLHANTRVSPGRD